MIKKTRCAALALSFSSWQTEILSACIDSTGACAFPAHQRLSEIPLRVPLFLRGDPRQAFHSGVPFSAPPMSRPVARRPFKTSEFYAAFANTIRNKPPPPPSQTGGSDSATSSSVNTSSATTTSSKTLAPVTTTSSASVTPISSSTTPRSSAATKQPEKQQQQQQSTGKNYSSAADDSEVSRLRAQLAEARAEIERLLREVNYLRQEKADLEARLGDKKKKKYQKAVVLYDFKGDTSNQQLVLKKGDVLTVTNKHESGWWTGEINGEIGFFPGSYVKVVDS